jgi:S-adenosylmethionine:tRNA ribosyltransferase-isomerase
MRLTDFDYELPAERIAQVPLEPRDAARLLVDRGSAPPDHAHVRDLSMFVGDGDLLVVNDTKVIPARLRLRRESGGAAEVLLLEPVSEDRRTWDAMIRPARKLRPGARLVDADGDVLIEIGQRTIAGDTCTVTIVAEGDPLSLLQRHGEMPLPPYIGASLAQPDRYQTVYANDPASAAAPTAGLHFTQELLAALDPVSVTLHVGLDTFRPVTEPHLEQHEVHGERYAVDGRSWERIAAAERVLAVGTTTVRVLETVALSGELAGRTTLFIAPGFEFRRVDALLTNFHLPRSTLLALVMAFVGVDATREIYRTAIEGRYRFYSLGDAMVVL